jgi:hypothetical protein
MEGSSIGHRTSVIELRSSDLGQRSSNNLYCFPKRQYHSHFGAVYPLKKMGGFFAKCQQKPLSYNIKQHRCIAATPAAEWKPKNHVTE